MLEICFKLAIKALERRVFIVNLEHISHIVLLIQVLALNK